MEGVPRPGGGCVEVDPGQAVAFFFFSSFSIVLSVLRRSSFHFLLPFVSRKAPLMMNSRTTGLGVIARKDDDYPRLAEFV